MKLANRVAIITGAGSGIGRAASIMFANEGSKIVVADINDANGKETEAIITQNNAEAVFIHADVTKSYEVENLITASIEKFGKIDILFNNAGITHPMIPVDKLEESVWDTVFNVNVKGIFLTAKYAVPVMKKAGVGVIINMASIAGIRPRNGSSAYASSKAAVINLTKELALELASYQIRVNCICPVMTETPMLSQIVPEGADLEQFRETLKETIPLGRLVRPEEIAYAALYLASDESAMMTGTSIVIDGGRGL